MVTDHLSRLGPVATPNEELRIDDSLPDEQLFSISHQASPWYADLVNFKVVGCHLLDYPTNKGRNSFPIPNTMCKRSLFFFKLCGDGIYKRCLLEDEVHSVLHHYHASTYGVHFGPDKTITKVL